MRLLENQVEKKKHKRFRLLEEKQKKRLAGAELSCVTGEVCACGMDAGLYEIRGVSLFSFFFFWKTSLVQSGFFYFRPSQKNKSK